MTEEIKTETTETTEAAQPQVITIEGKTYDAASITEIGVNLLKSIRRVDTVIDNHNFEIALATTGRDSLVKQLSAEAEANFTAVEVPAEEPPAA